MGLDIYLEWDGMTAEESKARYTGFANAGEIGYLRSSYNSAGFNSWAQKHLGGKDLYYIFEPDKCEKVVTPSDKEYAEEEKVAVEPSGLVPDWDACMKRAKEVLELVLQAAEDPAVIVVGPNMFSPPSITREEVIGVFKKELARYNKSSPKQSEHPLSNFTWYSNATGEFFMKDAPVVMAAIPVKSLFGEGSDIALVCKPIDGQHDYYIEMVRDHVIPFIETGKRRNAWMEWSS